MAKDLVELRKDIESIDKEMASLFEKRMEVAEKIAIYKKENGLPIYDRGREESLIEKNSSLIQKESIRPLYKDLLETEIRLSKAYQQSVIGASKVAYSGVPGAFAHIAAKRAFPEGEYLACPSFKNAYEQTVEGNASFCILPIENSYAGDVGNVMDLIFNGPLYAIGEIEIRVSQNLLGVKGSRLEDIKEVHSHPQALEQSLPFINKMGLRSVESPNTAIAAEEVAKLNDKSIAAIASKETAELYGLTILKEDINEAKNNTTRFLILSKKEPNYSGDEKDVFSLLLFTVKNEAGSLASALNIIGAHGFNMRNLKSRPMKELMWSYYFFVELEGNIASIEGKMMLTELKVICDRLKGAGIYRSAGK